MNAIILKKGRERSLERRHPWIYSGSIARLEGTPRLGETVAVKSCDGVILASGAFSPDSMIPVKIWSFEPDIAVDADFFRRKIAAAFALRKSVFGRLPEAYRLVNAESDGLPGLVADIYDGFAVCQLTGAGADFHRDSIVEILLEYAKGVYERSDVESRKLDGLELRSGQLAGEPVPENIEISENGLKYIVEPHTGHKTGFYLDQRVSRAFARASLAGAESVLNCFAYTGGFGLCALAGGAKEALNVDTSASSLALARKNAALNGFDPDRFKTETADVFKFLRLCRDSGRSFDAVILDPPKFAENQSQRERAARAYKDINLLALKLLRNGGKLFTFSCSGAMDADLFGKVVDSAACDAQCDFRITAWLSQGPDHPVSSAFPEGRYLKGLAGIVSR